MQDRREAHEAEETIRELDAPRSRLPFEGPDVEGTGQERENDHSERLERLGHGRNLGRGTDMEGRSLWRYALGQSYRRPR